MQKLLSAFWRPTDVAALAAFRIVFGCLMCFASIRFIAAGWVADLFIEPKLFFKYHFAPWARPWPAWGMYLHYSMMAACALLVALGLFYRVAITAFFLLFSYAELIDVTNYLNHYYLVSLLALLLCFLPLHRAWSLDALRKPKLRTNSYPAWFTYLLRVQVAVVYFYAGMAKAQPDWLLHAQPLSLWLSRRSDTPIIGPLLGQRWAWFAFSWAGFLFDSTIVFFLLWRRSRLPAYFVVIVFHAMTRVLFNIGMFPFIMVTSALIFFSDSWPRRCAAWLAKRVPPWSRTSSSEGIMISPAAHNPSTQGLWAPRLLPVACVYLLLQVLIPLRTHLYGGNVLWHEQGMRFSWRVMVREKEASIVYRVHSRSADRTWHIKPAQYLTPVQDREMSSQPDMILQMAKHIAEDFRRKGFADVEVRVDAWASLNGRPAARLIDPTVDLAKVEDGLSKATWILPSPTTQPLNLRPV